MSYLDELLAHVRSEIQVDDEVLKEARARRDAVRTATAGFRGRLDTYRCGSLAYGTAVAARTGSKGVDGDCGAILDRRVWNTLGPDSEACDGPCDVVDQVRDHIRPKLVADYPDVRISTTEKRALRVLFNKPLESGEDPPVEQIVALRRQNAPGLWIPNLKTDTWDPAHPQEHFRLINLVPGKPLRVRRARLVRLLKAWNLRYSSPAFSSFNLQAFALALVTSSPSGKTLASSLADLFEDAAEDLDAGLTEDPAGVSGVLKLQNDVTKAVAVKRLERAAERMRQALADPDDQDFVCEQLTALFGIEFVEDADRARTAAALSEGNRRLMVAGGLIVAAAGTAVASRRSPRAWGGQR